MQSFAHYLLLHGLRVLGVGAVSAVALIAHEQGHLLGARATGRQAAGWGFRWYGIGVRLEVGDIGSFWRVALAGPAASLVMAALLAPGLATGFALAHFAFWVNALMFLVNLQPVGPSDGAWVVRSLEARRAPSTSGRQARDVSARCGAARGHGPKRPGDQPARALAPQGWRVAWLL
jgi:Zn-dependent protease